MPRARSVQDHNAVVTFRGSVKAIQRIGRARDGGIEAEREQRSFEIIVKRIWLKSSQGDHLAAVCDGDFTQRKPR